jgi:very-short-patch-repair endonuclease
MNTKSFIEKAQEVHSDRYDYSLTEYSDSNTPITIICKVHGKYSQKPCYHLRGSGCHECGSHKSPTNKKTKEQFIEEAIRFHGDKFDYSYVNYVDARTKVTIVCKAHGAFEQIASQHLKGIGCKKCKYEYIVNVKRKPQSEFIEKAVKTHGDRYDYSKVNFTAMKTPVLIICKIHGEFNQKPVDHVKGKGCQKCGGVYKPTTEEWIKTAKEKHGDKYDYSKSVYWAAHRSITIICKDHGEFKITPSSHITKGHGCKRCSNRVRYTTDEWKEEAIKIHNNLYDYSKVNFTRGTDCVTIICKKHGEFNQQANCHLMGTGCSLCKNKTESKLFAWLKAEYPTIQTQKTFNWCVSEETGAKYRFDFVIPELNTIIELDGDQHFKKVWKWGDPEVTQQRDVWKMKKAIENKFRIVRLLQEDVRCRNSKWLDKELKPALTNSSGSKINYVTTERFEGIYDAHKELFERKEEDRISHV